jgi:uncharacterized membrane protein YraQ (UPF0718 family)
VGEVFFIAGLIIGLIFPFALLTGWGRKYWIATMSAIGLVVVSAELAGKVFLNKTISRMYWEWSLEHELSSWIVAGILLAGWLNLLIHLQWKVLARRFKK